MPPWSAIQDVWPLLIGVAAIWARLEVAMAQNRAQSVKNEGEIQKLEGQVETQRAVSQQQALSLARIEESLTSIGRTLERLDRKISNN